MLYTVDHDYHIHSQISLCSDDPEQTTARILEYAKANGLKRIVLTDHFWDEKVPGVNEWYSLQNFEHISKALPLPQDKDVEFLFGAETDMDKFFTIGVSKERFECFDFVIVPTTHLQITDLTVDPEDFSAERKASLWVKRLDALLNMDLPFHKIGIAHLACHLINNTSRQEYLKTLDLIPSDEMRRLFKRAAELGVGIELNSLDMNFRKEEADTVLRMFRIAKEQGCKFYLGSDAHHPDAFEKAPARFERAIDYLELTENDKYYIK